MLLFQRHFLPLLRSGAKTQTIRLWSRPRVHPGQLAYVPGLHKNPAHSRVLILSITPLKSLRSLTRADARADGLPSLRALLEEIHRLYPTKNSRLIFRIRFSYPHRHNPSPTPSRSPTPLPLPTPTLSPSLSLSPTPPPRQPRRPRPLPRNARRQLAHFLRHFPASANHSMPR